MCFQCKVEIIQIRVRHHCPLVHVLQNDRTFIPLFPFSILVDLRISSSKTLVNISKYLFDQLLKHKKDQPLCKRGLAFLS
ncbi:hypothetical protein J2X83_000682 [Brevibacillus nitrificans]|nr:hypothetical protein [Brevibacillus nitrificans]